MDWHEATEYLDLYCSTRSLEWIHNETHRYCAIVSLEHNEMLQIRAEAPCPISLATILQQIEDQDPSPSPYDPPPFPEIDAWI